MPARARIFGNSSAVATGKTSGYSLTVRQVACSASKKVSSFAADANQYSGDGSWEPSADQFPLLELLDETYGKAADDHPALSP